MVLPGGGACPWQQDCHWGGGGALSLLPHWLPPLALPPQAANQVLEPPAPVPLCLTVVPGANGSVGYFPAPGVCQGGAMCLGHVSLLGLGAGFTGSLQLWTEGGKSGGVGRAWGPGRLGPRGGGAVGHLPLTRHDPKGGLSVPAPAPLDLRWSPILPGSEPSTHAAP